MALKIRKGVFETNSSSTHSIAIPKHVDESLPKKIIFNFGEFGWEQDTPRVENYLYTAIYNGDKNKRDERLDKLKSFLDKYNVKYKFEVPKKSSWGDWEEIGNIDHSYELEYNGFFNVLDNENMLLRYLTAGVIYTGNDNENETLDPCCCARPNYYNYELGSYVPNPNHDETKYDYIFKGN